jgi:2-dehydropantoate 2-reductase
MRGEHYETCIKTGLNVTSIDGDIFIPPESLNAYKRTDEMGTAGWVVVALKSTSLDAIPDLICPLLHHDTRVLVIMNGLVEDDLVCAMNKAGADFYALYGGMALLCSNRLGPGRVEHSYAGFLSGGVATSKGTADFKFVGQPRWRWAMRNLYCEAAGENPFGNYPLMG